MAQSRGRVPVGCRHQPHDQECLFYFFLLTLAMAHALLLLFFLILQRCRGSRQCAQVILAQWHLPPLHLRFRSPLAPLVEGWG